ncbi:MAG: GNAT family N-acetyltransferase [Candidatus Lokiarchaeota archaeon]|nr:GNAT family N-acetyltransferase [Candidatus Lokiarchaeota archaeon]
MDSSENSYIIRPCTYQDLYNVIEINEVALPENYPFYFFEQIYEKYPESFLVAELTAKPKFRKKNLLIGYIMWRVERGISTFGVQLVKKGHLVSIAVLESFRHQGVASALLKQSIMRVKAYDVDEFVLEVRVSNESAVALYEKKFMFEKARVIEQYYRDGESAYYMALPRNKLDQLTNGV